MSTTQKIALVTGSSRGLGRNTAISLSKKGIDAVITYNSKKDEADKVVAAVEANGQKAVAMQLNTAVISGFDVFFEKLAVVLQEKWGRDNIDFFINNAGTESSAPFAQTTEEQFDALMNIHFKGVYFLTQKALPFIADGGRIINLSTGLARFTTPGYSAYASMKGAIETLTKYLAKELGPRRIAVNVVAPGAINTDFTRKNFDARPESRAYIASQTALGRMGEADDIGGVIAFLCSPEAGWINAQRIEASGGMFL